VFEMRDGVRDSARGNLPRPRIVGEDDTRVPLRMNALIFIRYLYIQRRIRHGSEFVSTWSMGLSIVHCLSRSLIERTVHWIQGAVSALLDLITDVHFA